MVAAHLLFICGDQMTKRLRLLRSGTAVGLLLLVSEPCMAQVDPFGSDPNTALLTDEDWRLLWEGAVSLNRTPDAAAGETRSWSDATSGNSGKVTLTRVFESNGVTCHALRYAISFSEHPAPQEYNFNWCRTSGGQWKIAP
jgi:surface antigen